MEYIIWNPDGQTPPRVRFPRREDAQREAERLAQTHAGAQFYVCALVSVSRVQIVKTKYLDGVGADDAGVSL